MKSKIYTTRRERMTSYILGFLAFPVVNIPLGIILWLISQTTYSQLLEALVSALPWLVNGSVIVLALLFRPQFGVGYVAFIAFAVTLVTALSILFVAACFVTFVTVLAFSDMSEQMVVIVIALMAVGLLGLVGIAIYLAIYVFQRWRSS